MFVRVSVVFSLAADLFLGVYFLPPPLPVLHITAYYLSADWLVAAAADQSDFSSGKSIGMTVFIIYLFIIRLVDLFVEYLMTQPTQNIFIRFPCQLQENQSIFAGKVPRCY